MALNFKEKLLSYILDFHFYLKITTWLEALLENWSKLALTVTVCFMEVKIASCTFSQAKTRRDFLASHADVLRGSPRVPARQERVTNS